MATLAPRRLASRVAIFAAIGLVAAVTSGFVTAGTASLATARVTGARSLLAGAPADAASIVVTTHLSDSPTAQDAAVEALVARRFAGVPVAVTRTTTAAPLTTTTGGRVLVGSDVAIRSVAHLVAGAWPTAPSADGAVSTVVQADAVAALHLRIGDELTVPGGGGGGRGGAAPPRPFAGTGTPPSLRATRAATWGRSSSTRPRCRRCRPASMRIGSSHRWSRR